MPYDPATFHDPEIDCYTCGNGYSFVGTGPHQGVCPACGSVATTPAGHYHLGNGTTDYGESYAVHYTDEAGRSWTFFFGHDTTEHELVVSGIRVEDERLTPNIDAWSEIPIPDSFVDVAETGGVLDDVDASAEEYSVRRVATRTPGTGRGTGGGGGDTDG